MPMFPRPLRGALAVFALTALPLPLLAEMRSPEAVLNQEIDMAGRQRLLSQRIAASACLLSLGVDAESSETALSEAQLIYGATLDHLQNGDATAGLPAASDATVLSALDGARSAWAPVDTAVTHILAGDATIDDMRAVAEHEGALLAASQAVVAALTASADHGSGDPGLAHAIDMAGRQRMLSQAAIKDSCLLSQAETAGLDPEKIVADLTARVDLFEESAGDLRAGNDETGIAAPPSVEVENALDTVQVTWQDMRELLNPAFEGEPLGLDRLGDLAQSYSVLLPQLEDVVWYYVNGAQAP